MKTFKVISSITVFLAITYFGLKIVRSFLVENELTNIKTKHFDISYKGIFREEANDLAKQLEDQYDKIRTDLNDPDHDTIRVFIHSTQKDFNTATGLHSSNANGTSRGPLAFHILLTNWHNSIFPDDPEKTAVHEFTHCVQLNILIHQALKENPTASKEDFNEIFEKKFTKDYPQWFWEALSVYQAKEVNTLSVQYAMRQNPTLDYLNNSNQIYNVGYTIGEYIVETWGKDKLPELITSYVDLKKVLHVDQSEFEKGWIEFVEKKY
jgi:hypothetical protein